MKKRVFEESVLLGSVLKWTILATCVGIVVGISTSVFLKLLDLSVGFAKGYAYYFLCLPAGMFISSLIVCRFAPEARGFGTDKVIEAVHKRFGRISPSVVPIKLIATIITIATGGSAGRIGPCGQIGAGITSFLADTFKLNKNDRKKLVVCGISAGFSSVLGTPIAAAIFAAEVLSVGKIFYDVLLPSFIASIVGYQTASVLGVTYFSVQASLAPDFGWLFFLKICAAGVTFGLCSYVFIEMLRFFDKLSDSIRVWEPVKAALGSIPLILFAFFFSTDYLGLGMETVQGALSGGVVPVGAFFWKMLFTAITLTFGGSGGIILPIFFIGSTAGHLLGCLSSVSPALMSGIGFCGLLAGSANTPIAASILAMEMLGPSVGIYAAVACIISFLITGHRGVFKTQQIVIAKSNSFSVQTGKALEEMGKIDFKRRKEKDG